LFNAGTELYRGRFVRSLAHELHVPLLVLDSSVLAPYVRYCIFFFSIGPFTRFSLRGGGNQMLQRRYIGHASNPWITNEIPQKQTNSKKNTREDPPPQNPNRPSLIHEDNTMIASSVSMLSITKNSIPFFRCAGPDG